MVVVSYWILNRRVKACTSICHAVSNNVCIVYTFTKFSLSVSYPCTYYDLQGLEGLPLLQWLSCAENHLPKVDGLDRCPLIQHLRLSQNNLQMVITSTYIVEASPSLLSLHEINANVQL